MTAGGTGFSYGDDFVALRVSMQVDDQGVTGLRTLTQEVDRLRVSTEAAGRSEDSFVRMLEAQATAADRAAAAIRNLASAQGEGGMGGGLQLNAPGQYVSPFAGTTAGMGMGRVPATVPEAQDMLEQLRSTNPRAYISRMAESGNLRAGDVPAGTPTDEDLARAAQRISTREMALSGQPGVASQVVNEFQGGGGMLRGLSGSTAAGLSSAEQGFGRMAGVGGGGGGGLLGSLGLSRLGGMLGGGGGSAGMLGGLGEAGGAAAGVGIPLAAVLGGYEAFQKGGHAIQGFRSMGEIRGGGFGQGVGYEAQIRQMALNPFITTEQARQIVQQGLREGYTGRTFDTVTQFVASNLKDMNVDISTSFDLVRKNVVQGNESMAALNSNLQTLKDLSRDGARSLPELVQGFAATSGAGIGAGMPGNQAAQMALGAGQVYAGNRMMAGTGESAVQAMMQPQNMAWLEYQGGLNVPRGVLPQALPYMLGGKAAEQATGNVLKKRAQLVWNSAGRPTPTDNMNDPQTGQYYNAVSMFGMFIQQMGIQWSPQQIEQYFRDVTVGGKDPFTEGQRRADTQQQQEAKVQERTGAQRFGGGFGAAAGTFGSGLVVGGLQAAGGAIADFFTGHAQSPGHYTDRWGHRIHGGLENIKTHEGRYDIPLLENVQNAYASSGGVEVLDEAGRPVRLDRNNRDQMNKLSSGDWKWRPVGQQGPGRKLSEVPMGGSAADIRNAFPSGAGAQVSGQITIGLTPEARQLITAPQNARLTPHEQAANQGWTDLNGNTASPNNPPPGYSLPRQYGPGSW